MGEEARRKVLRQAAEAARKSVDETARKSIEAIQKRNTSENRERYGCDCSLARCYTSCPRYLIYAESEELFRWWARTSPPDRRERDVLPGGPPARGSGSRSKRKKKKLPLSVFRNPFLGE